MCSEDYCCLFIILFLDLDVERNKITLPQPLKYVKDDNIFKASTAYLQFWQTLTRFGVFYSTQIFIKHCTKKWSFPLRISSVNVDLVIFTEEILNGEHFLCCEKLRVVRWISIIFFTFTNCRCLKTGSRGRWIKLWFLAGFSWSIITVPICLCTNDIELAYF